MTNEPLTPGTRRRGPARAAPPACPHRPPCPGCPRFGEHGIAPAARTALNALAQSHGLPDVAVNSGTQQGFRLRARLAIRGRVGSPKVGLFEAGTHHVVHIPYCQVQHPLINHVAGELRAVLAAARVSCYSEQAHLGLVRYLQVVIERRSQSAQVVLVANSDSSAPLAACAERLRERLGSALHSLWFNANTERTNTILGPRFERLWGTPSVIEDFGGAAIHYPPGAFGQSNLEIAGQIIDHVRTRVPAGSRVAEFYAGVGAIGLSLLGQVSDLRLNEVSPASLEGLELGLAALGPDERMRVTVLPGVAGAALAMAEGAEVVIADPPRRGLDPDLCAALAERPPARFIYISCSLESLLADTARLLAPGRLRLTGLRAFNLLPFTEHVETVAVFDRS